MQENNTTVYLSICDKAVSAEAGCDYSMPDYLPEIRRLLRVKPVVLPVTSYIGGGKAEFAGAVRYDILYSSGDGSLYTTSVSESYQLSAPLSAERDVDLSDELPAFCEPAVEQITARVTAPRRLSIRCRVRGRAQVFGRCRLCEQIVGDAPEGTLQRLCREAPAAHLTLRGTETTVLTEELSPEGRGGELRVIGADTVMTVSEALPFENGVGCRGEARVKLLLCREGENAPPFASTAVIPFEVTVPLDGVSADCECRATACCTETVYDVTEDGRVSVEITASVSASGQRNVPVHYTADLYSTACTDRSVYEEYRFPVADRVMVGNFTQSVYEPLGSYGLSPDCQVLDMDAVAVVNGVVSEKGRTVITGDTRLSLLLKEGGEYAARDVVLPFRYECEGARGDWAMAEAEVKALGGRVRTDGGRLSVECELAVSARTLTVGSITALCRAEMGDPVEKPAEMVVAFPERGESLWSVAKRYHAPVEELARRNAVTAPHSVPLPDNHPIVVSE